MDEEDIIVLLERFKKTSRYFQVLLGFSKLSTLVRL